MKCGVIKPFFRYVSKVKLSTVQVWPCESHSVAQVQLEPNYIVWLFQVDHPMLAFYVQSLTFSSSMLLTNSHKFAFLPGFGLNCSLVPDFKFFPDEIKQLGALWLLTGILSSARWETVLSKIPKMCSVDIDSSALYVSFYGSGIIVSHFLLMPLRIIEIQLRDRFFSDINISIWTQIVESNSKASSQINNY